MMGENFYSQILNEDGQSHLNSLKQFNKAQLKIDKDMIYLWSSEIASSVEIIILMELIQQNNFFKNIELYREEGTANLVWYVVDEESQERKKIEQIIPEHNNEQNIIWPPILYGQDFSKIVTNSLDAIVEAIFNQFQEQLSTIFDLNNEQIDRYQCQRIELSIVEPLFHMLFSNNFSQYINQAKVFYSSLNMIENVLSEKRFLLGDNISLADIKLYCYLIRFDIFYARYLGPLPQRISDFKNISGYLRDLYQVPEFSKHTDFESFGATWDINQQPKGYWMSSFYDMVVPTTDWDTLYKIPSQREILSVNPSKKFFALK